MVLFDMDKNTKIVEFVSFCIEMYAKEYDISGSEAAVLLEKKGLLDYLFENYEILHTQGREYIIPLLNDFVQECRK